MANKRISRSRKRELETPDEFITFTGKLLQTAAQNRQKIIGAGCVLAVFILIIAGFRYYSIQTERKAFELLQAGLDKINTMNEDNDAEKLRAEIKTDFETVVNKYSGKKAGKIARVLLADMASDAGDYDSAISLYSRSLKDFDKDPFYSALIFRGLAHTCELNGDNEGAKKYMETVKAKPDVGFKDEMLYNLGRMASKSDRHDKKTEYFQEILASYPDSVYADMVKEKVDAKASDF